MNMGNDTCDTQLHAKLSLSSNERVVLCTNPILTCKMEASVTVSKLRETVRCNSLFRPLL